MTGVFRAPMRSRLAGVPEHAAAERALALDLCGLGGRLASEPSSLADALRLTDEEYDERAARRLERFVVVPDGATVWTRDADGFFRCGTLSGPWRYDPDPEAFAADLVHVRPCTWEDRAYAEHEVPAPVAATFRRGGLNWQEIH